MNEPSRECTTKCKSKIHAGLAIGALIRNVPDEQIFAYLYSLCFNFANIQDEFGRTVLLMASSCRDRSKLVEWIIKFYHVSLAIKDLESGWTALHRALFYGQITTACSLLKNGATFNHVDYDGLSALDLVIRDINSVESKYTPSNFLEMYVWGSNSNFNLGGQSQQHRDVPNLMECFAKQNINMSQVVMKKYHTVFLSENGVAYSCGHGQDGRLGIGSEQTRMVPSPVNVKSGQKDFKLVVTHIAAGDNHTVLLTSSGDVYTCGLNDCHQLGHNPPPTKLLVPTKLNLRLPSPVKSIFAATFHTVICTKDSVYTCGLNAGQLGHPKSDRTQVTFRKISRLNKDNINITHVSVSNGSTVCVVGNECIYIFHEYKFNKLPAFPNIVKIEVIGGKLDFKCDPKILSKKWLPLKMLVLNAEGNVYLLENSCFQLTRCMFIYPYQPFISNISLHVNGVLLTSQDYEGFCGEIIPPIKPSKSKSKTQKTDIFSSFIDRNDCPHIKLTRLTFVQRAARIFSNLQGKSFSVLQHQPIASTNFTPETSTGNYFENFQNLLLETFVGDGLQDVIIKVGDTEFPAHKCILASCSAYFKKVMAKMNGGVLEICNYPSEMFEAALKYMYSDDYSDVLGYIVDHNVKISGKNLCTCINFDTNGFSAYKAKLKMGKSKCRACSDKPKLYNMKSLLQLLCLNLPPKALGKLKREDLSDFSDITIVSSDGTEFLCHKCVLVARMEYFRGMFTSCWIEGSSSKSLNLQLTADVLEAMINFAYEDDPKFSSKMKEVDYICSVLAAAEQFLIEDLKKICEWALFDLITLKNVPDILQFSLIYNAKTLHKFCLQYISHNLSTLLEIRSLEDLDKALLDDVSQTYRDMIPWMSCRVITPYGDSPSSDEIEEIANRHPVVLENFMPACLKFTPTRARQRSNSQRCSVSEEVVIVNRLESMIPENEVVVSPKVEPVIDKVDEDKRKTVVEEAQTKNSWLGNNSNFPNLDKSPQAQKTNIVKGTKLSQKQKKKLAAIQKTDIKIEDDPKPNRNPWQVSKPCENADVVSLKEIMKTQVDHKYNAPKVPNIKPPSNCPKSRKFKDLSPKEPEIRPAWDSQPSPEIKPQLITNNEPISMVNIIENEVKASAQLVKIKSKPLNLIQIEDRAIEELQEHYGAKNNPDEFIVVQRLLQQTMTPIWQRNN